MIDLRDRETEREMQRCTKECIYDKEKKVCSGCGRTLEQIAAASKYKE